jgi:hypothetical protein
LVLLEPVVGSGSIVTFHVKFSLGVAAELGNAVLKFCERRDCKIGMVCVCGVLVGEGRVNEGD